jgi:hypothetical protein
MAGALNVITSTSRAFSRGPFACPWLALMLGVALSTAKASDTFPTGDGTSASRHRPAVPEPMVFDLVRPLGALRGEAEVNTLAEHNLGPGGTAWAPELEFMLLDGLGIEFEFPFENLGFEEWKLATQLTLGTTGNGTAIHGLQVIGRMPRHGGRDSMDVLYLLGAELGGRWSTLGMFGLRRQGIDRGEYTGLVNGSVFYEYAHRLSLGLETNWEIDERSAVRALVIPQVHVDIDRHVTVQAGVGASWLERGAGVQPVLAGRLIYAF